MPDHDVFRDPDAPHGPILPVDETPEQELPGAVLMIPNSHWGIPGVTSTDHPGACAAFLLDRREGVLVSGTDRENVRRGDYFLVDPTPGNGLTKPTAFKLVPRHFRFHRLRLYFPERHIGRLDDPTLRDLQYELARLHPEEG